jgi:hypothetical protein
MRVLACRPAGLACALAGTLALTTAGSAQAGTPDEEHAAAVESFHRGTKLVEQGKLQDAIDAFRTALVHEPSGIGARLDLADCYEKVGAPAQAWHQYALAAAYAATAGDPRLGMAHDAATHLQPQLVTVTVTVKAPVSLEGVDVRVDGEPLERGLVRIGPVALAPGRHHLEATLAGKRPWVQEIEGGAGDARPVTIAFADEPRAAAPPSRAPSPEPAWPAQKTWAIVAGSVGVAGLATGAVLGLVASSKKTTLVSEQTDPGIGATRFASDLDDAKGYATASTVAFIGGGVFVAAGAVLWLTAPSPQPSVGLRVRIAPELGRANGLVAVGSF